MWADMSRLSCRTIWVALVAGVLLVAYGSAHATSVVDYCLVGERTSVFIVDRTTKFDKTDEQILISQVETFYGDQTPGERVVVVAVSGAYTEMRIVFNECRPGCPEANFIGRLMASCRPVLARGDLLAFERRFITAVRELLRNQEEAPASDLFRAVAESTRMMEANTYRPLRQVLLYSDLLESSSLFPGQTIRRAVPEVALRRLSTERVEAKLQGARVRVVGFGRDDAPNRAPLPQEVRRRVEDIWRQWLRAGGAADVQIGLR
jgi:hypothetical protein